MPYAYSVASDSPVPVKQVSQYREILLPDLQDPNTSVRFNYLTYPKHRFSADKFTIVYLPGGPGVSSSHKSVRDFPSGVQLLLIDPRVTGINFRLSKDRPDLLASKHTVNDVFQIIKSLNLKNYAIWGHSYGTVLATMLTHRIEVESDSGIVSPSAVVLEGTLGRALDVGEGHLVFDLSARVDDFFAHVSAKTKSLLREYRELETNEMYERFNLELWFKNAVSAGKKKRLQSLNEELIALIELLNTGQRPAPVAPLSAFEFNQYISARARIKSSHLSSNIFCKELISVQTKQQQNYVRSYPLYNMQFSLPCTPPINSPDLYNSKDFQITETPVYYLQGFNDFQTPLPTALYHKHKQKQLHKDSKFLLVIGSNHSVFSHDFESCIDPFFQDIQLNDSSFLQTRMCADRQGVEIKDY